MNASYVDRVYQTPAALKRICVRHRILRLVGLAALVCTAWPTSIRAASSAVKVAIRSDSLGADIERFSVTRGGVPLWFGAASGDARGQLLRLINTAKVDGLNAEDFEIAV